MSLVDTQVINDMAVLLYEFLPGSGNNNYSFPIAASKAGVSEFWSGGSKRPALMRLLQDTLDHRRHRFCPLILAIVQHSLPWRAGKSNPVSVNEIDDLNALLRRLEFKIPELHDAKFRTGLAGIQRAAESTHRGKPHIEQMDVLARDLVALSNLEPIPRGIAFEKFLSAAFELFGLAPRSSFSLRGEQIDGSFNHERETYLLEAKWQGLKIGNRELQSFAGSVHSKSAWTRGLFVSYSGFTEEGLDAFARGNATRIICIEGQELWQVLNHHLDLADVLARKTRRAAETGKAFVSVSTLFSV